MSELKATIAQSKVSHTAERFGKENDKKIAKWVLVDCRTGEHTIEIEFYKCRNYRCDVVIWDKGKNIHLLGIARAGTKAQALVEVLEKVGITFEPRIYDLCPDVHFSTPIDLAVNAIADALEIPRERRTIVSFEAENIHPQ